MENKLYTLFEYEQPENKHKPHYQWQVWITSVRSDVMFTQQDKTAMFSRLYQLALTGGPPLKFDAEGFSLLKERMYSISHFTPLLVLQCPVYPVVELTYEYLNSFGLFGLALRKAYRHCRSAARVNMLLSSCRAVDAANIANRVIPVGADNWYEIFRNGIAIHLLPADAMAVRQALAASRLYPYDNFPVRPVITLRTKCSFRPPLLPRFSPSRLKAAS